MSGTASSIECALSGTCCRAAANFFPVLRMSCSCGANGRQASHLYYFALGPPAPASPSPLARAVCLAATGCLGLHSEASESPVHVQQNWKLETGNWELANHINSHRSRSARNRLVRGFERVGVEIGHLQLCDVLDLFLRDRSNLGLVRLVRALREICGPLQEDRRRRRLRDEGVGTIRVHGDDDRDDQPFILGRLRVEVFAEVHDIDAVRTERGPDRRRRGRFPRRDLELHHCLYFLRHYFLGSLVSCQLPVASYQLPVLETGDW